MLVGIGILYLAFVPFFTYFEGKRTGFFKGIGFALEHCKFKCSRCKRLKKAGIKLKV